MVISIASPGFYVSLIKMAMFSLRLSCLSSSNIRYVFYSAGQGGRPRWTSQPATEEVQDQWEYILATEHFHPATINEVRAICHDREGAVQDDATYSRLEDAAALAAPTGPTQACYQSTRGFSMKIAVFSAQTYDKRFLDEANLRQSEPFELRYQQAALSLQTVAFAQGCDAICVFVNDLLDAPVLDALKRLGVRGIFLRCAGFNNVDLDAAHELGFLVARVPAYSPEAVAEYTIALIMTLNRQTHRAYNRVREGNFMLDGLLGMTLHEKTFGIIGTGKIGLAVAKIANGFGCKVLGYDPVASPEFATLGEMVEMNTLLARADIVTLHCPLVEDNRHLINAEKLHLMKPGAMLINTSRGALIDTRAVIAALKSRRLGALAIDVYEEEGPLFFQDRSSDIIADDVFQRLMTFPNVLVTGHQGFFTIEAMREIAGVTFENLNCLANGTDCPNIVARP